MNSLYDQNELERFGWGQHENNSRTTLGKLLDNLKKTLGQFWDNFETTFRQL